MIEERQRRTGGERVQPQRDLGEFDRHRVLVDAVDAALEHHAFDEILIGKLRLADRPVVFPRLGADALADVGQARQQRRRVIAAGDRRGLADGGDDAHGEMVDQADEKMPRAHRGIADLQIEYSARRIGLGEFAQAFGVRFACRAADAGRPFGTLRRARRPEGRRCGQ